MSSLDGELIQVAVPDLHRYWPLIKPGLEEVKNFSVEDWIAEDVYTAIRTATSTLHVAFIDRAYAGFCVLTLMQGYSSKSLHLWCVYNALKMDVLNVFRNDLDKLALDAGARKLTFLSPRSGWERRLKDYGFKPVQTVFEKELICQAADPQT